MHVHPAHHASGHRVGASLPPPSSWFLQLGRGALVRVCACMCQSSFQPQSQDSVSAIKQTSCPLPPARNGIRVEGRAVQQIEHHVLRPIPYLHWPKRPKSRPIASRHGGPKANMAWPCRAGNVESWPMLARKSTLFRDTGRSSKLTGRGQDTDSPSFRVSDLCSWTKRFAASLDDPA